MHTFKCKDVLYVHMGEGGLSGLVRSCPLKFNKTPTEAESWEKERERETEWPTDRDFVCDSYRGCQYFLFLAYYVVVY